MRRPSAELRVENPNSRGPTLDEKLAARRAARAQKLAARRARRAARRELLAARVRLQRMRAREKVRQGAFLLPSLLTVSSVFLSFWAIIAIFNRGGKLFLGPDATQQDVFVLAAWLLFAAFLLDGLDGKVARLTGTSSEFGVQLDSLADVLSFGMAPALLAYNWALQPFGRVGWLVSFLFLICGACRLARFNVQTVAAPDKRYFTGLPIPCAALTIAALVLNFPEIQPGSLMSYAMLALVATLSYLMVSRIRYRSFKDIDFRRARSSRTVALIALFLCVLVVAPQLVIVLLMGTMVMSGPIALVWGSAKANAGRRTPGKADAGGGTVEGVAGARQAPEPARAESVTERPGETDRSTSAPGA